MNQTFNSNGKLLLTGEYVVLDGATALAIPTKYGQSLAVETKEGNLMEWESIDFNGKPWFTATFDSRLKVLKTNDDAVATTLIKILKAAQVLNPTFLNGQQAWRVTTTLNFERDWGLGSSSTLINNIAQWALVNAFQLLEASFGGSGYDIAAAQSSRPILFSTEKGTQLIKQVALAWDFTDKLFFVHLNCKQDSKAGIAAYRNTQVDKRELQRISDISQKMLLCYTLEDFEKLLASHEQIISNIVQLPPVKELLFSDYPRFVKSLGAWGGDFVLATGDASHHEYFKDNGYTTIIPFSEMIL